MLGGLIGARLAAVPDSSPVTPTERPALWVGHVALASHDLARSLAFYEELGLRRIGEFDPSFGLAQLEMRGGTHLALVLDPAAKTEGRVAPFDLMADDVDALQAMMVARGDEATPVAEAGGHRSFTFTDPDGYLVTVHNSHVEGVV
jgi:catechol 2,3-dioxygenase-like lactoylglutathione lyase family enzyme